MSYSNDPVDDCKYEEESRQNHLAENLEYPSSPFLLICIFHVCFGEYMEHSVHKDYDERVHKGDNHPNINHLDVGSLGHRVEHRNKQRGKGHQDSCIGCYNTFKHFISNKMVGELVDNG